MLGRCAWRMTKAYHECGCALGSVAEERDQLYHDRFGVHALLLEKREEEVLENLRRVNGWHTRE